MANFKARSRALRRGRFSEKGRIYFVTAACSSRARLFDSTRCAEIMMEEFAWQASRDGIESLAHVIMPDHVHWLVQLLSNSDLSMVVRSLKGRSARHINIARNTSGPVWQQGFHDHALRSDEALIEAATYLIQNPLRAGLVGSIGDYPFWRSVWHCRS